MESKSIRVRKETEKSLRRLISNSKKKIYKLHFASDAIEEKIARESESTEKPHP